MRHIAKIVMLTRQQMTTTFFLSLFVAIIGPPFLMILIRRNQESLQRHKKSPWRLHVGTFRKVVLILNSKRLDVRLIRASGKTAGPIIQNQELLFDLGFFNPSRLL
jgi:hypothetical protein